MAKLAGAVSGTATERKRRRSAAAGAAAALLLLLAGPITLAATVGPIGPTVAAAAECLGDECEAPPPPPEDPTPGTAVVKGPSNPPVRFPKPHHRKPHHKPNHRQHDRPRGAG